MDKKERQTRPTIKELLEEYYRGLEKKGGWGHLLSEDFLLSGTVPQEIRGRDAYMNLSFFKLVNGLKVKELIEDGETAFVLVSYDLVSPKGRSFSSEVAELWKAKGGELVSVAIYFDTTGFSRAMA
jgi:ketosteroid isomerase-like protein